MPAELRTAKGEPAEERWVRTRRALREALQKFLHEDSLMVSASIAYHCLLAIFPLLLLVLGVSGIYIRRFELAGRIAVVLQGYLPVKTDFIMQNLVGISRAYGRVGLISFLLLLWSSSGVFLPLENALNRAWEVEPRRTWWQSRLLALEMALVVGCLIMLSTLLVAGEILCRNWLGLLLAPSLRPLVAFLYQLMAAGGSFGVALLMFVILFERLPNRPLQFRQAFPGAVLTALLWVVARSLFILFLPLFNYRHVYGSIGVVVALMTWAYVSSAVMLFGAQVSRSLYRTLNATDPAATTASPAP
jgi:YihY family inner membrane protein